MWFVFFFIFYFELIYCFHFLFGFFGYLCFFCCYFFWVVPFLSLSIEEASCSFEFVVFYFVFLEILVYFLFEFFLSFLCHVNASLECCIFFYVFYVEVDLSFL